MEFVDGPTLAERVANGPLSLDETLPIAKQIAEALEYARERGIIHRDLKPANVVGRGRVAPRQERNKRWRFSFATYGVTFQTGFVTAILRSSHSIL